MDCLGENTLGRWLDRLLPENEAEEVERHLDACAACRALIASAATASQGGGATETASGRPDGGPVTPQPGLVVAGKYRIERILGSGGMGVVAAAEHLALRQRVALKFIKPAVLGDASAVARFVREARAAVRLSGPHVARVLDLGTGDDGAPFIVMEQLEGEDLGAHLEAAGPLSPARAVELLLEACEGVVEAHAAGLIHRDLKPSNLFLARQASGKTVLKVLDFGISKTIDAATESELVLTRPGSAMGSPLYSAPEQLLSARDVDRRVDIWALGVIAYQMLAGRLPFAVGTLPQVVAQVLHSRPPPLAELRPELSPRLIAIVERCMARDPADRFASVEELAAALARYAEETPTRRKRGLGVAVLAAGLTAIATLVALELAADRRAASSTAPDASIAAELDEGASIVPLPGPSPAPSPEPDIDAAAASPHAAETRAPADRRASEPRPGRAREKRPRPRPDAGGAPRAPAVDAGSAPAGELGADELLDPR